MYYVNLVGGSGNRFFQVLFAAWLKERFNESVVVGCFDDGGKLASCEEVSKLIEQLRLSRSNDFSFSFSRRGRRLLHRCGISFEKHPVVSDSDLSNFLEAPKNEAIYIFDGYWQTSWLIEWWCEVRERLIGGKHGELRESGNLAATVAVVQVRRGDYARGFWNRLIFSALSLQYYIEACEFLSQNYAVRSFDVVSDDPEYTKQFFLPALISKLGPRGFSFQHVSATADADLERIRSTSFFVGANSTFGLFAWLTSYPKQALVIFPKRWFRLFRSPLHGLNMSDMLRI